MRALSLSDTARPLHRVLAIGAHSDDIEIGCGGTLMRLRAQHQRLELAWLVLSAHGARADEARASAAILCAGAARTEMVIHSFRDGFLPYEGASVKEAFEDLKKIFDPDLIFTHFGRDAHQDHRLVSELTWNTFRDHLILEFEIPKYDGDMGSPNVFVRLDEELVQRKVAHLATYFPSQSGKHWFSEDVFRSVLRLRGMECNSPSRYAEAFYARKLSL
jgi:LmbE family N-acetylglucosaminyl deacetylase